MAASPARKTRSASPDERLVRLRVVCVQPPDPEARGAEFGLQDKDQILHPGQVQPDGSFLFDCELRVQPNPRNKNPNFLGPYAHGTPGVRFLYLSWRQKGSKKWKRRMKIHLSSITHEQIKKAGRKGKALEAAVKGTAKDGGLNCASVPLLDKGWVVRDIPDFRPVQPA